MDLFAAEIGMDPAEVRRKNLLPPFTEPHKTAFGAPSTTPATTRPRWTRCWTRPDYAGLRDEQAKRRAAGDAVQLGIGAVLLRGDHRRRRRGGRRRTRTARSRCTRTAPPPSSPGPPRTGRATQTVWAMLASEELGIPIDKITVKWGDTDLIPEGGGTGGSRSLQQGGAAVRQASLGAGRGGPEAGGGQARGQRDRPGLRRRPQPVRGGRRPGRRGAPGRPGRDGAAVRAVGVQRARARRSRSARTWPSSRWTPRPARCVCAR